MYAEFFEREHRLLFCDADWIAWLKTNAPVAVRMTKKRNKVLLLDDDRDLLDLYREILSQLPSHPEVQTAQSGARAISMLESQPFYMLICDLNMPKMDGLQVLSIVRKKFPLLRTVVLTAVPDEQFRSRVYALGVDLYWQKPSSQNEIKLFMECLEALLDREQQQGFRGVQQKNLVDIIQLECISQNSTVLKITNGPFVGHIWIQNGELIDAAADNLVGEEAFQKILSWKTGAFESLAADPERERKIFKSYNALLLETAQAFDEARGEANSTGDVVLHNGDCVLETVAKIAGVEFAIKLKNGEHGPESHGLKDSAAIAAWAGQTLEAFRSVGEKLHVGTLEHVDAIGSNQTVSIGGDNNSKLCVGWTPNVSRDDIDASMRRILALCAS